MITSDIQATTVGQAVADPAAPKKASDDHGFSFHNILSAMNPLQYLPVVGTIYRAVTGDVIPEALQRVGSFVVSGLLGGPIGLLINAATTVAEKVTGIDPDAIVTAQFNGTPAAAAATQAPAPASLAAAAQTAAPPPPVIPTSQQLAAYGDRSGASAARDAGDTGGADVLNTIELARLDKAAAAYAAYQTTPMKAATRSG